ncbi:hypothetical protein DITRI_Ditri18aG0016900 [Diplodiscus trichospermus]
MRIHQRDIGGMLSLALFVMIMLMVNTDCSRAAAFMEKSNTSFRCGGSWHDDDCSLIAEDMELELLMDSYISRMLIGENGKPVIDFTKAAGKTLPCGEHKPYGPCVKGKKVAENCNPFNRNC